MLLAIGLLCHPLHSNGRTSGRALNIPAPTTGQTADDTIALTRSSEGSFFEGVIPVSPQAAALARYAEYPVSLVTGIPDITIPLYEIKMGDFTLPITISYHSAGARPDEIHTSVGQGWCLNAGGAITRTILSGPDIETKSEDQSDYTYYDMSNINGMIGDVENGRGSNHLTELLNPYHTRDSESDRYCFNAGGHTGVFRYSHKDGEYEVLDRASYIVISSGSGMESKFVICCPDNTEYYFSVREKTGPDPEETDPHFTTSWFLSEIATPYGTVKFTYRTLDDRFFYKKGGMLFRAGFYPRWKWIIQNMAGEEYYEFDIKEITNPGTNMYFLQKHISTIEWNGNRIEFNYEDGHTGEYNLRLASMVVKSADGETVKTVSFGNDRPWQAGSARPRRMLRTLEDSASGTYRFTYNENNTMPDGTDGGDLGGMTDSWGYYNGTSSGVLPESVAGWLSITPDNVVQNKNVNGRDRSPSLSHTKLGVLNSIKFPTGGIQSFEYELNELNGMKLGGLRIASTTLSDGTHNRTTSYEYGDGIMPQMHPDSLCKYMSYLYVCPTTTMNTRC